MNSEPLSWHQQNAARRAYATRNLPAHIRSDNYSTALCGAKNPTVTIETEHRDNPANKCCKTCKRIADKAGSHSMAFPILRDGQPVAYASDLRIAEGIAAWYCGTVSPAREIVPFAKLASKFDECWPHDAF